MKLLLLRCPVCTTPLKPNDRDIVVACENCKTAVSLSENGIQEATVRYGVPTQPQKVTGWLPFWITHGQVNITSRETQGRHKKALKEAQEMWSRPRYLYVPAWELPIPEARMLGSRLIKGQGVWQEGEPPSDLLFTAANVTAEDANKLLELIILTIEAERKDWLKDLRFTIEAPEPTLWLLPATTGRQGVELLAKVQL